MKLNSKHIVDFSIFALSLLIITMIASLVFSVPAIINNGFQGYNLSWPIEVQSSVIENIVKDKIPEITQKHPRLGKYPLRPEVVFNKGTVRYKLSNKDVFERNWLNITQILMLAIVLFFLMIALKLLYSVNTKGLFSKKNIKRMYWMSGMFIVTFFYQIFNTVINHNYIIKNVELENHQFVSQMFPWSDNIKYTGANEFVLLKNSYSFMPLFYAVLIIILIQVVKNGLVIKEDNDSIL